MFNIKEYQKNYYLKNKKIISKKHRKSWKKYWQQNKEELILKKINRCKKYLKLWEGFIPKKTKCQICGKIIYFNIRNINHAIHFDHRNNINIIKCPTLWLSQTKRTTKSEEIWNKCNFGMLCGICNRYLPTKNREEFIKNAIKYIKEKIKK